MVFAVLHERADETRSSSIISLMASRKLNGWPAARRTTWIIAATVLVAAASGLLRAQTTETRGQSAKPNVVLIISDDHHWSDYSFLGHTVVQTPHLDRLARQSLLFPRGYVPTSLCSPSLATIITGLYPSQHGITGNDPAIPANLAQANPRRDPRYMRLQADVIARFDRVATLPRRLADAGYVSFQTGKWWGGHFQRGGFTAGMTHGDPNRGGRHGDAGLTIGRQGLQPIFDFIESSDGAPFFVWYAPFLPHTPHNPPEKYLSKYVEGRPPALAKYYAMVQWFDETCGQLLDYLDRQQLTDNTIVIYVSDNGWIQRTPDSPNLPPGWNRSFAPRSKQSPYEGGVRTPIMVRWPDRIMPATSNQLACSIDIVPTVLAAAGVALPADLPGENLLDVADGQTLARKYVFGEVFAHDMADLHRPDQSLIYSWAANRRWKLIQTHDGQMGRYANLHPQTKRSPELYDLLADPHETRDLAEQHPQVVREMVQAIELWRKQLALRNPVGR